MPLLTPRDRRRQTVIMALEKEILAAPDLIGQGEAGNDCET